MRFGLAVAVLLALPATALAERSWDFDITGWRSTASVEFHGDPARGCADHGVCAVSGHQTVTAKRKGFGVADVTQDRHGLLGLFLQSVVGATHSEVTDGAQSCTDDEPFDRDAVVLERKKGRSITAVAGLGLDGIVLINTGRFDSVCSGPLPSAIEAAVPKVPITSTFLRRKRSKLQIRGTGEFHSHGFSGTASVETTVWLRRIRKGR